MMTIKEDGRENKAYFNLLVGEFFSCVNIIERNKRKRELIGWLQIEPSNGFC